MLQILVAWSRPSHQSSNLHADCGSLSNVNTYIHTYIHTMSDKFFHMRRQNLSACCLRMVQSASQSTDKKTM